MTTAPENPTNSIPFRAETRQLLNILIHSLYTDREVFLRELISNASDSLTRLNFITLTDHNILSPEQELGIWIETKPDENTLILRDTGLGMTEEELVENLGTIAHSGAKAFMQAAEEKTPNLNEIIGQFGVGFYSAFMVAEWIRVNSRSYQPESTGATWFSEGEDNFSVSMAEKAERGTEVIIKLKPDASEFAQESRLRQMIRTHSDYIPFPIYLNDSKEQVNRQTALWRQNAKQVKEEEYTEFYKQLTLDPEPPLAHLHLTIDAPVQMYALLFIPAQPERGMFSPRTKDGLKLFARKVLIEEYDTDLLPAAFRFVQGVVDSEDIPLNVSRESVQSSRVMAQLKKVMTGKLVDLLKNLGKNDPPTYDRFWKSFGRWIKEGVATDAEFQDNLMPLLRFHSLQHPQEWVSLDQYVEQRKLDQNKIFYLLGEEERSLVHSPHLEAFRRQGLDVLMLSDPLDPFMLLRMSQYQDLSFANVVTEELPEENLPEPETASQTEDQTEQQQKIIGRFQQVLRDKVSSVKVTNRLIESPARLVDQQGSMPQEIQRVYRYLNKEYDNPDRVLEINLRHPILQMLLDLPEDDPLNPVIIEQVYEDALLMDGAHPDPASMVNRIQTLIEAALKNARG